MPPSGFVPVETTTLASVAESLLTRFAGEVTAGVHASEEAGIEHELSVINAHIGTTTSEAERGVLHFVRSLYLERKAGKSLEEIVTALRYLETKSYV